MRAALVTEAGAENFTMLDDVRTASVDADLVRVRMHRASLCHSDLSLLSGLVPHSLPCVAGHEGAGEVVEVGARVSNVQVGDRVIVLWIAPCQQCPNCLRGETHLCTDRGKNEERPGFVVDGDKVMGLAGKGTFAEETLVSHTAVYKIPDDLPYDLAALIGCGITTGLGAVLNSAPVHPGASVAVIGVGGVGISVVQGARLAGASRIVAVDPVESRREWALQLGATHAVAPEDLAQAKQDITGGFGFDYAYEAVGRPTTLRDAYAATRRGGTVCLVGVGSLSDMTDFSIGELLYGAKKIVPSNFSGADIAQTFHRIIGLWRDGSLDLESIATHRVSLNELDQAVAQMRTGEALRTVITIGEA